MRKPKTRSERETAIITLHNQIVQYGDTPATDKLRATLKRQLSAWFELIQGDVAICIAQNEQTPWTAEELGYQIKPMFKKAEHGFQQVGDYQIIIDGTSGRLADCFSSLLIERKGCTYQAEEMRGAREMIGCDLYGTLLDSQNHKRFVEEIKRFKRDDRFETLIVVCECSYEGFLGFKPPFNGKTYNFRNGGASIESRIGAVNALFVDHGVQVLFAGTRERAIAAYRNMIRQAVMRDYVRFIKGCE